MKGLTGWNSKKVLNCLQIKKHLSFLFYIVNNAMQLEIEKYWFSTTNIKYLQIN